MRLCERNKKTFYYAEFQEKAPILDENGFETGRYKVVYGEPIKARASISASRGFSENEQFGLDLNYTNTIITDDMECPIEETSILWLNTTPVVDEESGETITPHNYVVVAVAKSLNHIVYAVRKVDVQ